jgi:hypothetical protein
MTVFNKPEESMFFSSQSHFPLLTGSQFKAWMVPSPLLHDQTVNTCPALTSMESPWQEYVLLIGIRIARWIKNYLFRLPAEPILIYFNVNESADSKPKFEK